MDDNSILNTFVRDKDDHEEDHYKVHIEGDDAELFTVSHGRLNVPGNGGHVDQKRIESLVYARESLWAQRMESLA